LPQQPNLIQIGRQIMMEAIKSVIGAYTPLGAIATFQMMFLLIALIGARKIMMRHRRFMLMVDEIRLAEESALIVSLAMLAGIGVGLSVIATIPPHLTFRYVPAFLVILALYAIPLVLVQVLRETVFKDDVLGIPCGHCARFVHFVEWLCNHCDTKNSNWFVGKCKCCRRKATSVLCPHCGKEFPIRQVKYYQTCARVAPPPELPYAEQQAELQRQLETLRQQEQIAELRRLVQEKAAEVKRANDSFGLSRLQQMQLEIQAQIDKELAMNLEQKLVFSRKREQITKDYADDPELLRDALAVLAGLEQKAIAEAMSKPTL
jgi:hypothetical protein